MAKGESIHSLINTVEGCMAQLGVDMSPAELESVGFLLYYSLKPYGRYFHSIKHALDLTVEDHPLISLSALFHDLIYYQIDHGFTHLVEPIVRPIIREETNQSGNLGKLFLVDSLPKDDIELQLNLSIFNFSPGQELNPFAGLNEFLSSVVMTRTLSPHLTTEQLAKMIVYIEGTIPFRGPQADGRDYFYQLFDRFRGANSRFHLGLSPAEISQTIIEAVELANRDVQNFAEPDARDFLDNTWDLIPETNVSLRRNELYTIRDYRVAIEKMNGFFSFLNPQNIFHRFEGHPSHEKCKQLYESAKRNVETSRSYLRVKYTTAVILEAFAEVSGGDCPICYVMGELPQGDEDVARLEHYLPDVSRSLQDQRDPIVWRLLDTGRNRESVFDIKNAPLSLFIYAKCNDNELNQMYGKAKEVTCKEAGASDLIQVIPLQVRSAIALAIYQMAPSRQSALEPFLSEVP